MFVPKRFILLGTDHCSKIWKGCVLYIKVNRHHVFHFVTFWEEQSVYYMHTLNLPSHYNQVPLLVSVETLTSRLMQLQNQVAMLLFSNLPSMWNVLWLMVVEVKTLVINLPEGEKKFFFTSLWKNKKKEDNLVRDNDWKVWEVNGVSSCWSHTAAMITYLTRFQH